MTRRLSAIAVAVLAAALTVAVASAGAAAGDPQPSSNWSGYAIARTDATTGAPTSFHAVSGSWTAPTPRCVRGEPSYSAFWIGLGGASESSNALEQIGTSADCTSAGKPDSYVWYEIVPAASVRTKLRVSPGDQLHAVVSVNGTSVIMRIQNLTRHTVLTKRVQAAHVDISSAEWIAEAPSACTPGGCRVLPLTNFGTVQFTQGLAVTTDGRTGAIASSEWDATPIRLVPTEFASSGRTAIPSALGADGASFSVSSVG